MTTSHKRENQKRVDSTETESQMINTKHEITQHTHCLHGSISSPSILIQSWHIYIHDLKSIRREVKHYRSASHATRSLCAFIFHREYLIENPVSMCFQRNRPASALGAARAPVQWRWSADVWTTTTFTWRRHLQLVRIIISAMLCTSAVTLESFLLEAHFHNRIQI